MMLRNKYKYSKNHGLLPHMEAKPYRSPVSSVALLGENEGRQYQLCLNPNNDKMFIMFNQREYLHKQCSFVTKSQGENVVEGIVGACPFKNKTLTVYIANDYQDCERNIVGDEEGEGGLIWRAYEDLVAKKKENSSIVLSVLGVEGQNQLIDLLMIDRPEQMQDIPETLKEQPYIKRRIKVGRHPNTSKYFAQNAYIETVRSKQELRQSLQRYKSIKNEIQTMKLMTDENWRWMQGQLIQLSEIEYDEEYKSVTRQLRTHYFLRINQYLRSTASTMLKLGMNLRRMQERFTNVVCDNNQSKLFRLLSSCFNKKREVQSYHINVIYQIGHYRTIKDEYQNLVPTSELISNRIQQKSGNIQNASFLYLKHYHDYARIVGLLAKMSEKKKDSKSVRQFLDENNGGVSDRFKVPKNIHRKSYICDTFSSLEKKILRNQQTLLGDQYVGDKSVEDLQTFVKKTAKLYKDDDLVEEKKKLSKSGFKKSDNKTQQRMSLFQWGLKQRVKKQPKIIRSEKHATTCDDGQHFRQSADYIRGSQKMSKWTRASNNRSYFGAIYGKKQQKQQKKIRSLTATKHEKDTRGIVDDLVKKEIIELGRDEEIYKDRTESDFEGDIQ